MILKKLSACYFMYDILWICINICILTGCTTIWNNSIWHIPFETHIYLSNSRYITLFHKMIITICHIPFDTNMNLSNSRLLTFLIQQPFFSNLKDSLSYPVTPKSVKPKLRAPNGCKKNWGPILAFFFKFKGSFTMSRYSHIRKTKIKDTTWLPKKLDQKKYISYLFIFLNFNGPRAGLLIITSRIFVLQPDRWMSVRLDPLRFFFGKKKLQPCGAHNFGLTK